jgi:hypothetical protein
VGCFGAYELVPGRCMKGINIIDNVFLDMVKIRINVYHISCESINRIMVPGRCTKGINIIVNVFLDMVKIRINVYISCESIDRIMIIWHLLWCSMMTMVMKRSFRNQGISEKHASSGKRSITVAAM